MTVHDLIGRFTSTIQLSHKLPSRRSPHRLTDNLHWKCPACKSHVATCDTQFHLIGCLITIVDPMSLFNPSRRISSLMSGFDTRSDKGVVSIKRPKQSTLLRPQTRVVRRPTPNINHPVIPAQDHTECKDSGKSAPSSKKIIPANARKAIEPRPECHPEASVKSSKRQMLSFTRVKADDANPSRKLKSKSCSQNADSPQSGSNQGNDLHDEVHAMSRLMVKGQSKQPHSMDKLAKVPKPRDSGCDQVGWECFKSELRSCSKCKRSFFPHRVAAHEKVCTEVRPRQPEVHSISRQSFRHQKTS